MPWSEREVVLLAWPFELFIAATLIIGATLTMVVHAHPLPILWVDMGPAWAVAWTILALIGGGMILWGLWRSDLSAIGAGLIMGGVLLAGYLLVATFNDSTYPSVLSHTVYSASAIIAIARGVYCQRIVSHARRALHKE